jgi:hypothetical protein
LRGLFYLRKNLFTDDAQSFYDSINMQRTDNRTGYQTVVGQWLQNTSRKE